MAGTIHYGVGHVALQVAPNTKPIISVIIATQNAEPMIGRCLNSIIGQTRPFGEILVADGGSIDGTVGVLRSFDTHIAWWESASDQGIYHAWNKALSHATGDWICFLGADDHLWNSEVLERMAPFLNHAEREGIKIVYGRITRMDETGRTVAELGKPWNRIAWRIAATHLANVSPSLGSWIDGHG